MISVEEALERVLSHVDTLEAEVEPLREAVAETRSALAGADAHAQTVVHTAREREQRIGRIAEEARRWHDRAESAKTQAEALANRKQQDEAALEAQVDLPAAIAKKRESLAEAVAAAETERKTAADRLAEAEAEVAARHQHARKLDAALGEAREQHARAEARLEAAQEREASVARTIRDELNCAPEQALAQAELEDDAPVPKLGEIEAQRGEQEEPAKEPDEAQDEVEGAVREIDRRFQA